jgi:hypothetical protein
MFKRGDFVYVTVDQGLTVTAMVVLASTNGRSLAVSFDGALPVGDGFALGFLPILQGEDGVYRSLIGNNAVTITRIQ